MELRDFIVAPIVIFLVYTIAFLLRSRVTDSLTRGFFIPALTVKIVGAIALGLIYQFYYDGGDTFYYHTGGSRIVWETFMENPIKGFQLFMGMSQEGIYKFSSKIYYFGDPPSYFIIRMSTIFDFFTFSSYAGTSVLFSVFSFTGMWMLFLTFYRINAAAYKALAFAILFVPSVIFWGSGILKDSVTLGCLGIATYSIYNIFFRKKYGINVLLLVLSFLFIYALKKFILMAFVPAVLIWIFMSRLFYIRTWIGRALVLPFIIISIGISSYWAVSSIGSDDSRYEVSKLAKTAKITAYDIRFGWGARYGQGSGYTLGELDGSFRSMLLLAPQAINASLFRPYIWEAQNPLMLLSALESLFMLLFSIYVFIQWRFKKKVGPEIIFCFVFSLVFAFAVGVSTYNFGTLSRYKVPLVPYYLVGLCLLSQSNMDRKLGAFEVTE